ncbi:hypothetical protein BDZ89DRAFT_1070761 [Hymenopellis radicata]|nr:hypothetical protein BDZ89DRAFT_1070761 [Hymenopellis radicata]
MIPTRVRPASLSGFGNVGSKFNMTPKGGNTVMGVALLMGATALAYYWGYNDMDKRHPMEANKSFVVPK